ncbi:hypothetical protein ACOBQB_10505 [Streptomyces sp. G5(2025)]|uniref:hypothetical protein n=1 Tax=Streptomyces sp. G5(2025) TaxID=3406628 RepID=UPI003C22B1CB
MEQISPLNELALCIEHHNETLEKSRGLWAEAEQASRRIGHLVGLAMTTGTSWAELGRLLAAVEDTAVPSGLKTPRSAEPSHDATEPLEEQASLEDARPSAPVGTETDALGTPRVLQQGKPEEQSAEGGSVHARALQIVREVQWPSGVEVATVMRVLASEGHTVTEHQTRAWLDEWTASGQGRRVEANRYLRRDLLLTSPTLATGDHAPLLLRRAHQIVAATPEKEMSTRRLAAALDENVQIVGGELCSMLREAGITRPNRGKIGARYGGTTGPRLPGYTAEALGQAIAVYNARGAAGSRSGPGTARPGLYQAEGREAPNVQKEGVSSGTAHPSPRTGRERALELVQEAGKNAMSPITLIRQLSEEGHLVTDTQVRTWLKHWMGDGLLRESDDSRQIGHPRPPGVPDLTGDAVPQMLIRARDAARGAGGVISSQQLFAALQGQTPVFRDASDMAGRLVSLLNKVGVSRPDRGRVQTHPTQSKVAGFTASTLDQGVTAYQRQHRQRRPGASSHQPAGDTRVSSE